MFTRRSWGSRNAAWIAFLTLRPNISLFTRVPLGTLATYGALFALSALRTHCTLLPLGTQRSLGAHWALLALSALGAHRSFLAS
ncbi:MAG: hypothetical protein ABSF36_03590 [Candidatus Methanomethylicaceae archaeon]